MFFWRECVISSWDIPSNMWKLTYHLFSAINTLFANHLHSKPVPCLQSRNVFPLHLFCSFLGDPEWTGYFPRLKWNMISQDLSSWKFCQCVCNYCDRARIQSSKSIKFSIRVSLAFFSQGFSTFLCIFRNETWSFPFPRLTYLCSSTLQLSQTLSSSRQCSNMLVKAFCTLSGANAVVFHPWILCLFSSFPDVPLVHFLPSSPVFNTLLGLFLPLYSVLCYHALSYSTRWSYILGRNVHTRISFKLWLMTLQWIVKSLQRVESSTSKTT